MPTQEHLVALSNGTELWLDLEDEHRRGSLCWVPDVAGGGVGDMGVHDDDDHETHVGSPPRDREMSSVWGERMRVAAFKGPNRHGQLAGVDVEGRLLHARFNDIAVGHLTKEELLQKLCRQVGSSCDHDLCCVDSASGT